MANDLISREAAIKEITALIDIEYGYEGIEDDVRRIFDNLPAVDAEPVRRGKWIITHIDDNRVRAGCLGCDEGVVLDAGDVEEFEKDVKYCPRCGAKMEVQNETD